MYFEFLYVMGTTIYLSSRDTTRDSTSLNGMSRLSVDRIAIIGAGPSGVAAAK